MLVATTQTCQHHWLLSEPRQGVVPGVCKLCGTHREYPARLEQTDRFFDHQELIVQTQVLEPIYKTPAEERPD